MTTTYVVQYRKSVGWMSGTKESCALVMAGDGKDAERIVQEATGAASASVKAKELKEVIVLIEDGSVVLKQNPFIAPAELPNPAQDRGL
jgi:hypothetical protein